MLVSRVHRLTIILSAAAALGVQLWLASYSWPNLPWIGLAACVLGVISARRELAAGYWTLLGVLYLYPVAIYPYAGVQPGFTGVVAAGAFGLALGAQRGWDWSLPRSWVLTLGFTALVIAVTWPIIAWREIDFTFSQLFAPRQAITWQGIPPHVQIGFLSGVAAAHLVGLIFLDSLVRRFHKDLRAFQRLVLAPLAVAAGISAAAALYQMTVDVSFINPTIYAYLGRASGTMLDANAFGMIAAMWASGAAWLLVRSRKPLMFALAGVSVAIFAGAVWATGSRTATLALLVSAPFLCLAILRSLTTRPPITRLIAGIAVLVGALGLVAGIAMRSDVVGPWSRLSELESLGGSLRDVAVELRDRGGYGQAARSMIADAPYTGVGVGAFHALVLDYAKRDRAVMLTPDNAQNWFRHQVAEFGWIGAAGYLVWTALFVFFVARRLFHGNPTVVAAAGALAGLLAASLFGMPTQEVTVLLTFWAFVAWVLLAGDVPPTVAWKGMGPASGALMLAAILYAAGAAHVAFNQLRVPFRAAATGWDYRRGLHGLDDSAGTPFRWTEARAVTVVESRGKYLVLRFRIQHPDAATRPVAVKIKLFNQTIVREWMRDHSTLTRYVKMSPRHPYVPLSFEVSRTFQAPDADPRQLGLAVDDWTFVDAPPPDGWVVDAPIAFPPPRNPYN